MVFKRLFALLLASAVLLTGCACSPGEDEPKDTATPAPTAPVRTPEPSLSIHNGSGMVAAGGVHTIGVRTDGTLLSAGHNSKGQREVDGWRHIIYAAVNDATTVGLTDDGSLEIAGEKAAVWIAAQSWTELATVSIGSDHIVGLRRNGTLLSEGGNEKGQRDLAEWSDVVDIACASDHTIGLRSDGTVIAAGDNSFGQCEVGEWSDIISISTSRHHTVGLKSDGTVVATEITDHSEGKGQDRVQDWADVESVYTGPGMTIGIKKDKTLLCAPANEELSDVENAAYAAISEEIQVIMSLDGSISVYGEATSLQDRTEGWLLRPYKDSIYVKGFAERSRAGRVIAAIAELTGKRDIVLKYNDTELLPESLVGTNTKIYIGDDLYGTVVIMGEVNGDSYVNEYDAEALESHNNGATLLAGAYLEASKVNGLEGIEAVYAIRQYMVGEGKIAQFPKLDYDPYSEKYDEAYEINNDVVGWITIPETVIDYPILYGDNWYYHERDIKGNHTSRGSIYTYRNAMMQNNPVTGHNARNSKTMFHALHDVQDNAEALLNYSDRVWGISLFGEYAEWEIFSLYETKADEPKETIKYNTNSMAQFTEEDMLAWIDTQVSRSEIAVDVRVDIHDQFVTLVTCGDNYDSADAQSRLYIFLKRVS